MKLLESIKSIIESAFDELLMVCIHVVSLEINIIELNQVIKLNKLFQTVMTLILVFLCKIMISLFDWGVNFISDVIETGSILR